MGWIFGSCVYGICFCVAVLMVFGFASGLGVVCF